MPFLADGFVSRPRIKQGILFDIFSRLSLVPMGKSVLLALSFSRDSLALKTENGALSGVVYRVKSTGPSTEPYGTICDCDFI